MEDRESVFWFGGLECAQGYRSNGSTNKSMGVKN